MQNNGESQSSNSGRSAKDSLLHWLSKSENFRSFLIALASRHSGRRSSAIERSEDEDIPCTSDYLVACCEQAIHAHTVEDALYWHSEIVTELAAEAQAIRNGILPDHLRAAVIASLEDRMRDHSMAVRRLHSIIERQDQLIWQP